MGDTVYLDHAASTPMRPEARDALARWFAADVGNASAVHGAGQEARIAVEEGREQVATALGVAPRDVVFTSGGTESDNLAIKGLARAAGDRRHVVVSAVEHPAVAEPAAWLAAQGFDLTVVPPRLDGRVDVQRVLAAVRDDTAVVSVMWANNEVGAVNDVPALASVLADRPAVLHSDAVQAMACLDVSVPEGLDALSLSAHKFGGPQGVGVVVLRRGVPVEPLLHGGGQDRGVRSGTFAAAMVAACGAAATAAVADRARLVARSRECTDRLAEELLAMGGVRRNGPTDPTHRLATHLHLSVDGVDGPALTLALDRAGVYVAAGAACTAGALTASPTLRAMGVEADATLRLSVGHTTTDADVDRALDVIPSAIARLRS